MTYEEAVEDLIDRAISVSQLSILQLGTTKSICMAGLLDRKDDRQAMIGCIRETRNKWKKIEEEAERIFSEYPDENMPDHPAGD